MTALRFQGDRVQVTAGPAWFAAGPQAASRLRPFTPARRVALPASAGDLDGQVGQATGERAESGDQQTDEPDLGDHG